MNRRRSTPQQRFRIRLSLPAVVLLGTVSISSFQVFARDALSLNWTDLLPENEQKILANPPESLLAIPDGSDLDVIPSQIEVGITEKGTSGKALSTEEQAYFKALKSTNINTELNNKHIRIPGYIVPVELGKKQRVTEFFFVPYFGACLHVPPPPPNQIIYVKYAKGLDFNVLYDPFWLEGKLFSKLVENDMASSAYTVEATSVKPYMGEFQRSKAIQNK